MVRVNLTGVFLCSQAAARVMRAHGGGRIINVASIYGLVGLALHAASPYAATKSGVVGLTRALAVEWAAAGIRVQVIRVLVSDQDRGRPVQGRGRIGESPWVDDQDGAVLVQPDAGMPELGEPHQATIPRAVTVPGWESS